MGMGMVMTNNKYRYVLWIKNCSAHSKPIDSHVLVGIVSTVPFLKV